MAYRIRWALSRWPDHRTCVCFESPFVKLSTGSARAGYPHPDHVEGPGHQPPRDSRFLSPLRYARNDMVGRLAALGMTRLRKGASVSGVGGLPAPLPVRLVRGPVLRLSKGLTRNGPPDLPFTLSLWKGPAHGRVLREPLRQGQVRLSTSGLQPSQGQVVQKSKYGLCGSK